jgi:4-hydroxy-tetrahydrodipicolinate synthase
MELPCLITALITPFDSTLGLELECFSTLIQSQIQAGVRGLLVAGSTGEGLSLRLSEKKQLLDEAKKHISKDAILILGISSPSLVDALDQIELAKECSIDAALVTPPFYVGASQAGIIEYYRELLQQGLPIIVYHHPGRTGVFLEIETLKEIAQLQGVVGIKESSGDLAYGNELVQRVSCPVFCGNDDLLLDSLKLGFHGAISVISNALPSVIREITSMLIQGDKVEAQTAFNRLKPILDSLSTEVNPVGIKSLLQELGISADFVRTPLIKMPFVKRDAVRKALETSKLDELFETF